MMNAKQIMMNEILTRANVENSVATETIIGTSSIFDYLPFVLLGICLISFFIVIGTMICLFRGKKKAQPEKEAVCTQDDV